jgi:multidrug resistance efflux pump
MHNKRPPVPVVIILLIFLAVAAYFLYTQYSQPEDNLLTASGSIEATEITVSSEIGGRVSEVLADEGDTVNAGQVLLRLDAALLEAQRNQAAAALETARAAAQTADAAAASAQAQYDLLMNNILAQTEPARKAAWVTPAPGDFDLPMWYFTQAEQIAAAQAQVEAAQAALKEAEAKVSFAEQKSASAGFMKTEQALARARIDFQIAQAVLDRARTASDGSDLEDAAQTNFDDARQRLEDAQEDYKDALTSDGAKDVLEARAELMVARETLDSLKDALRSLQTGEYSLQAAAAGKQLEQARKAAEQAQAAVNQARANLDLLNTQLSKLEIAAPADGVILLRRVQPGEVIAPAGKALILGLLDELTLTVYVPEDRYGGIRLGQTAEVSVDSFPGEKFRGVVTHIADKAEFTPRNVQTAEGRSSTFYAIKLRLDDPAGKLKPGMPADVIFGN